MGLGHSPRIVTDGLVMCLDAANQKSFSPNVFPGALDLYTWYVTRRGSNIGNACTVAQDNSTSKSPAGGIPMRMDVTGTDPHISSYNSATWNISSVLNSQTWTLSIYVKGNVATTGQLFLFGADSTGVSFVGGNWLGIAAKGINITTEWVRHDLSITFNNASIAYIHMRLDGPDTGGTGQSIWWDGLQLELGSSATTFNSRVNTNGTTWTDLSGNGRTGTLTNGPTFSSTNGGSIVFAGASSTYASVGNIGVLPSTGTINYWMRSTDVGNYRNPFSTHRINGNVGFRWEQNTGGTFYVVAGNDAGSFTAYNYTTSLAANTWYMVSVAWNTATSTITGYLNGTQVFNSTTHTQWATTTATDLALGSGYANSAERYYTGNISNAQVYNRALSAAEIQQNFNALRGRFGI